MKSSRRLKTGRPPDRTLPGRRREEILAVAGRVFAERGFPGADVQEVADRVGVGKGTVYRYFPTKRDLFLGAVDRGMRLLKASVDGDAGAETDPLRRIARAIRAYLAFFDEHPQLVELIMQERAQFKDRRKPTYFQHRDAHIGPWRRLFRDLIAAGRVRRVPVDRITDTISDLLYGTIFTNHFSGRKKSVDRQAEDVLDVLLNGILVARR